MTKNLSIEVAYALPDKQLIITLEVTPGTTALEAVMQSGMEAHFPDLDIQASKLGIFGQVTHANTVLQAHDRVEIYRPLQADPKQARQNRAKQTEEPRKKRHKVPPVSVRTR